MKPKIFLLTLMLLTSVVIHANEKTWHLVTDKGKAIELAQVNYLLAASTETFDIVLKDGSVVNSVSGIELKEMESSGISPAVNEDAVFSQVVDGEIIISSPPAGFEAKIYSYSGTLLISQKLTSGQNVINVSELSAGTYILNIGKTNVKFIKR